MMHATTAVMIGASLVMLAAPVAAQDCPSPTGRHVRVSGSAVLRVPPDRVSFSVGVETVHANVSAAFRANAQKVEAVLAALKAKGVAAKELQTSSLEVTSRNPDGTNAGGYRVANRVTVTREDAAGVGDLLQAAVSAGANEAGQLNFFVADPGQSQARGLELAFASARAKAETLAALSRQTLGDALCVSEGGGRDVPMANYARNSMAMGAVSVEPGTEALSFGVDVIFALK
jgi:uncharacterized protein YggE